MTDDLSLKELDQFYGSFNYYNVMGASVTDGIMYVMNNGYSWFVTDMLVILRMKLRNEEFCAVNLKLKDDGSALAEITDGNKKVLYTQEYTYTDAKRELKLFYMDGVLMLSKEY